jgi:shikimate kinase
VGLSGARRPLFLAGMMGAGKSTVGRALAKRLGGFFVDLDARIEHLFGEPVAELLGRGEEAFRRCEREALRSLLAEPGFAGRAIVVAAGGGTILDPDNLARMRVVGPVVYLEVPAAVLAQRLQGESAAARPLLGGGASLPERIEELLAQRRPSYEACDVIVDADGEPEIVAERVLRAVTDPP